MEKGIESFAGVIIENTDGEILLVRKKDQYAYAIPWCRITHGSKLQDCLRARVMDMTGLSIHPVFLGPNEHIDNGSHLISFDHTARIDASRHHFTRKDLEYIWIKARDLLRVPMVPLTRQILEKHYRDTGLEPELSSQPKDYETTEA